MKTRILSALVAIPPVVAAVLLAGPALFAALVLILALLALREYLALCTVEQPLVWGFLAAAAAILAGVPSGSAAAVATAALPALALLALWRVGEPARRLQSLAEGLLGLAYIVWSLSCLWLLRERTALGSSWLLLVLAATWAGDSVAYFVGTRFGRRRLAPLLSPKKTWAGAIGGLAGSAGGGLLALPLFGGSVSVPLAVSAGLAVGAAGQFGDLFESLWKRAKGVKDSGALIPGHGGILDRIDSLLIGFPVGYQIARVWGA